jgi:hypothetical protein
VASPTDPSEQPPASEPAPPPVQLPAPPGVQTNEGAGSIQPPSDGSSPAPASPPAAPALPSSPAAPPPGAPPGTSQAQTPGGPVVSTVQRNETTAGQLHDLLAEDSPYLAQARGYAQQAANTKGMVNSSLAVQSGEAAAIAAAEPIAQADAATFSTRALANQNALNQSQLSAQDAAQRLIELAKNGDIQSQLQMQKFGFDTQLSAQDNVQRLQQLAAQGDINAKAQLAAFNYSTLLADQESGNAIKLEDKRFQDTLGQLAQEYQNSLGLNTQDTQLWIQRQNVSHQDTLDEIAAQVGAQSAANKSINAQQTTAQLQSQYLTQVAQRQALASQEVASIYATQGLTPAQQQQAVTNAMNRLQTDLNSLQAYYQNSPMFDPTWGQGPAPGTPGSITGPGTMRTPPAPTGPTTQGMTPAPPASPTQAPADFPTQPYMPSANFTPDLFTDPTAYYQQWGGWQGAQP